MDHTTTPIRAGSEIQYFSCIEVKDGCANIVYLTAEEIKKARESNGTRYPDKHLRMRVDDEWNDNVPRFTMFIYASYGTKTSHRIWNDEKFLAKVKQALPLTKHVGDTQILLIVKYTDRSRDTPTNIIPGDSVISAVRNYATGLLRQWIETTTL